MTDNKEPAAWFAAKRLGFGAGLPIAWQGWLVYVAFLGLITGLARLPHGHHVLKIVGTTLALVALVIVTQRHTEGGWKWRRGGHPR